MQPVLDLSIAIWPLSRIKPYPRNARKITQAAIEKVAASLQAFGWRQPIVVDVHGVVVAGHVRLAAAQHLGWPEAPVHVANDLSPEQIRQYRLMDNRSHDEATWDLDVLALEMADLGQLSLSLDLTGFSPQQLSDIQKPKPGLADADAPAAPAAVAVSRRGDLWICGRHLVLCGDATSPADVANLLGARPKPVLMVTDPPYGVEYDPTWRDDYEPSSFSDSHQVLPNDVKREAVGKVQNDDRVDWRQAFQLFTGDVAYIWHASWFIGRVQNAIEASGFAVRALIIWRKQNFVFGRGAYHWQHEPCWYAVRKGAKAHWRGDRSQTTVWDVKNLSSIGGDRTEKATGHGTQKPVELMRRPIENHTLVGETVYDPFLGSGTTLIAAASTGRICYGIDLDPIYVDVAVRRWQEFTGQTAYLGSPSIFDEVASTFAEVAAMRAAAAATDAPPNAHARGEE
jgi:DNA modification methylase